MIIIRVTGLVMLVFLNSKRMAYNLVEAALSLLKNDILDSCGKSVHIYMTQGAMNAQTYNCHQGSMP